MNHILLDEELDVTKKGLKTTFGPSWTDYADDVFFGPEGPILTQNLKNIV